MRKFAPAIMAALLLLGSSSLSSKSATCQAKPASQKYYFHHATKNIPAFEKRHKGGEDAWVAQDDLLVVADGVGGWAEEGVDPALFSKQLCVDIKRIFDEDPTQPLKEVLVDAVQVNPHVGSSTAVLLKFDSEREDLLRTTNLGDSGYFVFRPNPEENFALMKMYKSKSQQYSFNFPYQCGTGSDLPYDADDKKHVISENDVVVVASDGMLDNLYMKDIKNCLQPLMDKELLTDAQKAADCLARRSERLGDDPKYFSPFAREAKNQGINYIGGKADDITVVVAQIKNREGAEAEYRTPAPGSEKEEL